MSAETVSNTAAPRLRRNVLDLPQVVFQGITHIAPSINIVFTFPIIALKAGPAMPISFFLTTIVCFFIGNTVSQFSKYMPSSGGCCRARRRGAPGRTRRPLPGGVVADLPPPRLHGRLAGHPPQAGGAAAVEPGGVSPAVLAGTEPGDAEGVAAASAVAPASAPALAPVPASVPASASTSSARWQAAIRSGPTGRSTGTSLRHRSMASGQRG